MLYMSLSQQRFWVRTPYSLFQPSTPLHCSYGSLCDTLQAGVLTKFSHTWSAFWSLFFACLDYFSTLFLRDVGNRLLDYMVQHRHRCEHHKSNVFKHTVACRSVARQRQGNQQLYNSRYQVTDLQTTAVARQWLCRDHVVTSTDMNATIALQQRNCVFYEVRVEI
jgi:hypothetical protein